MVNKPQKISHEERKKRDAKIKEQQEQPINKFLNNVSEDGKIKYPIAQELRDYFIMMPDITMNSIRMCNALVNEIPFHQAQSKKYLEGFEGKIDCFDEYGHKLTKEECYVKHLSESMVPDTVMSKMRLHITNDLINKIDPELFTFAQFNDYVMSVKNKCKEYGYELFPTKIEIITP